MPMPQKLPHRKRQSLPEGRVKYERSTLPVLQKTETDAELATKLEEDPLFRGFFRTPLCSEKT